MKPRTFAVAVAIACAVLEIQLFAQWQQRNSPKVPKTADGQVNFDAPPPRAADGRIDLSGVWENLWFYNGRIGQPPVSPPGEPPQTTFSDVGAGFKGGLPLKPWAAELLKQRKEQNSKDNPDAHCLPMGLMQFHIHPQPRRMIQTPDEIVIIYEGNAGIREIFTDGRAQPRNGDVQPWWYGYSVGHWEGDTLVVVTTGFRDGGWLDIWGSPLTDEATLTERFRRLSYGTMRIDVTIDDPKAYTAPFTVRLNQKIVPNGELIEFICAENELSTAHMVGK
jgi:hypothetical protein